MRAPTAPVCSLRGASPALRDPKWGQHPRMQCAAWGPFRSPTLMARACGRLRRGMSQSLAQPGSTGTGGRALTPAPHPSQATPPPTQGANKTNGQNSSGLEVTSQMLQHRGSGRAGGSRRRPLTQQMNLLRLLATHGAEGSHTGGASGQRQGLLIPADAMSPRW